MSFTISGTSGLTFPDATTMATGAQACKAWACWEGSSGTIQASYNVSSVTRLGTGQYRVFYTNAFADTKYVMSGYAEWSNGVSADAGILYAGDGNKLAASCVIYSMVYPSGSLYDATTLGVAVFR